MTKIKRIFVLTLAVMLIVFIGAGSTLVALADADEPVQTEETIKDEEVNDSGFEQLVEQFKAYLKDKYGADYEFYYNQIIEQWGSIEAYLLSFGKKLPKEYKSGWDKFVGWLGEYSVIWAPALAVLIVIIVALVGKKAFNKIVEEIVNAKLSPIVKELNLQSTATVSVMRAQRALLGNNERFAKNVKELEESERGLCGE